MAQDGIGASTKRREDYRFLKGIGKYTDDINHQGQTYCYFLRSPVAHAKLGKIDVSAAKDAPGVVAIFTATDLEAVGGVPCGWQITGKGGQVMKEPKHPILAAGKARHVGDPVVAVIADSLTAAKNAADLISIDYQELPAVIDMKRTRPCRSARQHVLRLGIRRQGGDRRRFRIGSPRHEN
jgi:aerobic carbon-monoxide dehydrogenase large subunit